ncbi:MAG: hypothetical protein NC301_00920 [Bacteroides sp.]|nr:hypothetical protein [Bacteroides sp.]MCM1378826.1 hypothetical protein [Bacteroides sp.]MCM1445443.1 hypothetical protein [Prevotella sp.]
MKKNILILALASMVGLGASAQETAEKQCCKQYLPQKGDFAIGVDVVPLFLPLANAIGGNKAEVSDVVLSGNPFLFDEFSVKPNASILAKYMLTDNWAVKANLGIVVNDKRNRVYATDDLNTYLDPNSSAKVIDQTKTVKGGATLQVGGEYRIGKKRVQGVFGFGILAGVYSDKTSYSYGNEITDLNRTPSTGINSYISVVPSGYRITEYRHEGAVGCLGFYGSAGFEWFVAPKISLGAEVSLNYYSTFAGKGIVKSEGFNTAYNKVEQRTDLYTPGNISHHFGTDNIGGALNLTFYF